MARRPHARSRAAKPSDDTKRPAELSGAAPVALPERAPFWTRPRVTLAVVALLLVQGVLAVRSLVTENPTVDEVIHLPAGISYWQTGSFRMYRHNPPLVKLVAALPVLASAPAVDYASPSWRADPPNKTQFAHEFMEANAARYFPIFTRARLLMPLFAALGGLAVFFWSRALYGPAGGLLSLTLWAFCPNVLAHTRLVTTDMGATAIGVLATYAFWRYLKSPSWRLAALAGVLLGLGQLTKFSLLLLYGLWPVLAAVRLLTLPGAERRYARTVGHAVLVVALSVMVIDLGYGFEGVGTPLGQFEFISGTLTRPVPPGMRRPNNPDPLLNGAYKYRVNRLRDTALGALPSPLPANYLRGFDDQKIEADGIPRKFLNPNASGPAGDELEGYPVYLDGKLDQKSWWYYYFLTLAYKVPEGTWLLLLGSLAALAASGRSRASGFDEFAVALVPVVVVFVMSVFTNINLGLRYVLPAFPYAFIAAGKLGRWASGLARPATRWIAWGFIGLALAGTVGATVATHPHYLAYFNAVSGGTARGSDHLIDSNLDWGQDLVGLRRWLAENAPGERVGLAYFGQIHPMIFEATGEGFDWFLPPPQPGTMPVLPPRYRPRPEGLAPGLYAVSASLVRGLPWRVYDSPTDRLGPRRWAPYQAWFHAFGYFRELTPIASVGGSIFVYRVTPDDAARVAYHWGGSGG